SGRIPEMRAAMLRQKGSRQAIAGSLPAHSAILEFVRISRTNLKAGPNWDPALWSRPRYFCFVLCDGLPEDVQTIDLGDADVIDEAVTHARTALIEEGLQMGLPSQPALRSARQAIFDPVEKCLRGRKRLFISPDADVATLPFETLLTDSGQPLVDEYSFSY